MIAAMTGLALTGPPATAQHQRPSFIAIDGKISGIRVLNAATLRQVFGAPASTDASPSTSSCTLRWSALNITADVALYGQPGDVCRDGYFLGATFAGARWRTGHGLHIGSSVRAVRRYALRRCTSQDVCSRGYILSQHRDDCAATLTPTLVAIITKRRLTRFRLYTTTCE